MQKLAENNKKVKKICLSGGGSGGPVSPLLAIYDELKQENYDFIWVGTKNGIEKQMVEEVGIKFFSIQSGKLRRYFSFDNFIDVFKIFIAFFQSLLLLWREKPSLIMSAGGFVSVPLVWAGRCLFIPVVIHQQDAKAGLANKLMAPFAKIITVTFKKSLKDFGNKAILTGNPVYKKNFSHKNKKEILKKWGLKNNLPIVLVMGGGTGALGINNLLFQSLPKLNKFCQIIHIGGKGKDNKKIKKTDFENYYFFEFLNSFLMGEVYALADLVVARAGMGTLTELSFLGKASIIIPMPNSHQEKNAQIFFENDAIILLQEKKTSYDIFLKSIRNLLTNKQKRDFLSLKIKDVLPKNASSSIIKIVNSLLS